MFVSFPLSSSHSPGVKEKARLSVSASSPEWPSTRSYPHHSWGWGDPKRLMVEGAFSAPQRQVLFVIWPNVHGPCQYEELKEFRKFVLV